MCSTRYWGPSNRHLLSRHLTRGIAWVLLGIGLSRPSAAVDAILVHGHVFTGSDAWVEAIAVNGGRIEAVGSNQAIEALRTSTTHVIDLQGRTVLPGIIDSHLHMLFGALELHGLNLSTPDGSLTSDNAEQFIATLSEFAASHPDDEVIFGRADFNSVEPLGPDHTLLDRAMPDRPVSIHNTSEHAL
jgi:predicted amidohydrolase YtcJ